MRIAIAPQPMDLRDYIAKTLHAMQWRPDPSEDLTRVIVVDAGDIDPRLRRCYHGGTIHCRCAKDGTCCGCEARKENAN